MEYKHLNIWSKEFIDNEPDVIFPIHLIPWFRSQISEIKEEIGKSASKVKKFNVVLKEAQDKLKECRDEKERKTLAGAIQSIESQISRNDLVYLEGRIYILEKRIRTAK